MFGGFMSAATDGPELARAFTDTGHELSARMRLEHLASLTVPTHAWACAQLGIDPPEQARRIGAAIDGLLRVGHRPATPLWWTLLAEVQALAGDREAAASAIEADRALGIEIAETVYAAQMDCAERLIRSYRPGERP